MMNLRGGGVGFLQFSQDIGVALHGSLLGNIVLSPDFQLWSENIEAAGVGMFFQPLWVFALVLAIIRRRWAIIGFLIFLMMLLGIRSFPWLEVLAFGPLEGFRWTWKLAIYASPLCSFTFFKLTSERDRWVAVTLALVGCLSLGVCFNGRHVNFSALNKGLYSNGLPAILQETSECLVAASVPPQARLVQVGDHDITQTQSKTALGLMGHTPLLLDRTTAHMYEPLERAVAAEGHLQLSVPWRVHIGTKEYLSRTLKIQEAFRFMGVTHLFTTDEKARPSEQGVTCKDQNGAEIVVWPLPNARTTPYPHPIRYDVVDDVTVQPDGTLFVASQTPQPPQLNVTRDIVWSKTEEGWLGSPQPLNPFWFAVTLVLLLMVLGFLRRWSY